jgi:hypothetical protein
MVVTWRSRTAYLEQPSFSGVLRRCVEPLIYLCGLLVLISYGRRSRWLLSFICKAPLLYARPLFYMQGPSFICKAPLLYARPPFYMQGPSFICKSLFYMQGSAGPFDCFFPSIANAFRCHSRRPQIHVCFLLPPLPAVAAVMPLLIARQERRCAGRFIDTASHQEVLVERTPCAPGVCFPPKRPARAVALGLQPIALG